MELTNEGAPVEAQQNPPSLLGSLEAEVTANEEVARQQAEDAAKREERRNERAAERTAYKQKRRFDAATFVPSVSHPYHERTFTLQSSYAQKLFATMFPRAQLSSYGISVMLPIIGRDDDNDAVEAIVKSLIDKHIDEMKKDLARLNKMTTDNSIALAVKYTDAKPFVTRIYAPNAARVLKIMEDYDQLNIVADKLWQAGLLTSSQRKSASSTWRRSITKLVRELHNTYVRAKASARRSADQRQQADDDKRTSKVARLRRAPAKRTAPAADTPAVVADDASATDTFGGSEAAAA